jgi:nucleoside-diphosphate-sugar epimerase
LLPRLIARARAGRLRLVGDGRNLVDSTYIDNAAAAHVSAADQLSPTAACAGKPYFVSNGEPLPIADLIHRLLEAAGEKTAPGAVSAYLAYWVGFTLEMINKGLRSKSEPLLTRFVARQLATAHWFDLSAIRRDLGYRPTVSIAEGLQRLADSFTKSSHT